MSIIIDGIKKKLILSIIIDKIRDGVSSEKIKLAKSGGKDPGSAFCLFRKSSKNNKKQFYQIWIWLLTVYGVKYAKTVIRLGISMMDIADIKHYLQRVLDVDIAAEAASVSGTPFFIRRQLGYK